MVYNWVNPKLILSYGRLKFMERLRQASINREKLCSVGDSITADYDYDEVIISKFPTITHIDKGIGGNMTSDVISRLDDILTSDADIYLLAIGFNDIRYNTTVQNWQQYITNMTAIINALKQNGEDVFVVGIWPSYPSDPGSAFSWENTNQKIDEYNQNLIQFCIDIGVIFINATPIIRKAIPTEQESVYVPDGRHPNEAGKIIYADSVLYGTLRN